MGTRRLLAIFAHPDDESLVAGGLLALAAADGVEVTIVSATAGEKGLVDRGRLPADETALLRTAEFRAAGAVLGATTTRVLELPDGNLAALVESDGVPLLASVISDVVPDVIVTSGDDGVYGHADHVALTSLVTTVVRDQTEMRSRLLHARFPKGLFTPVWRHLRRLPGIVSPRVSEDRLGADTRRADLAIDIKSVAGTKLAAVACHRSQLTGDDPRSLLPNNLLDSLLDTEWYDLVAGPPLDSEATGVCAFFK